MRRVQRGEFRLSDAETKALRARYRDTWRTRWTRPEHLVTNGPFTLALRRVSDRVRLAKNAPLALRAIKEAAIRTSGLPLEEAFRIEHELSGPVVRSQDAREGPRAFMEKREPVFTGH